MGVLQIDFCSVSDLILSGPKSRKEERKKKRNDFYDAKLCNK